MNKISTILLKGISDLVAECGEHPAAISYRELEIAEIRENVLIVTLHIDSQFEPYDQHYIVTESGWTRI